MKVQGEVIVGVVVIAVETLALRVLARRIGRGARDKEYRVRR